MLTPSKHEILVVEDDEAVRDSLGLLLQSWGYDVSMATNGFEGLLQLKRSVPAVVLSDLNMPQMSGFEFLSVVRQRFPQISVIAMSGAYHSGDCVPSGVIADAFYSKGHSDTETLLHTVAELIGTSAAHSADHQRENQLRCGYPEPANRSSRSATDMAGLERQTPAASPGDHSGD